MVMVRLLRWAGATVTFVLATAAIAGAQSWSWTYMDPGVSAGGLSAATLDLSATQIRTQNRVAVAGRPDVVYGCTIRLDDVSRAIAVHTGTTSLLISLKPGRAANCQIIGRPQSVVLRADDGGLIDRIADRINSACCSAAAAPRAALAKVKAVTPAPPRQAPRAIPQRTVPERTVAQRPPSPRPRPSPSPTPVVRDAGPRLVRPGVAEPVPGKTGVVRIAMLLGPDGSPQDARVLSSTNDDLDDAGIEIAVSSIYAPAVRRRRAVSSAFFVTVSFVSGVPSINATTSARQ